MLPKAAQVPDALTGGLGWLGVRQPAHPVALELIRATGQPLAAPSANPFMQLSPTTAEHVARGLGDAVGMILDGGACAFGIESTVVRIKPGETQLLRPGAIPRLLIEQVLGHAVVDAQMPTDDVHASPGQHPRHYAPRTPLMLAQTGQRLPPGRGALLAIDAPFRLRPAISSACLPARSSTRASCMPSCTVSTTRAMTGLRCRHRLLCQNGLQCTTACSARHIQLEAACSA